VIFWTKGEEARLELGGKTYSNCRDNRVKAVWEEARLRGVDFRTTGNEPGWYLEISEGERILLVADYGERRVVTPAPAPEVDPRTSRTRYVVRTEAHALTIVLEPGPCRDSMSGVEFPTRVSVTLDGREYRGCGRALGAPTTH
jgi:putative lipoprotein